VIDEVCANNDCFMQDEGRPECFRSHRGWLNAHAHCYVGEDGEPQNDEFHQGRINFNA
jgi:hypothetical protein